MPRCGRVWKQRCRAQGRGPESPNYFLKVMISKPTMFAQMHRRKSHCLPFPYVFKVLAVPSPPFLRPRPFPPRSCSLYARAKAE